MARSYYSTILEQTADEVWRQIRDFGHYSWAGVDSDTYIENERPGDAVGSVRKVRMRDKMLRQRLLAHSDLERFYTYEFCLPIPFPVRNYQATLHVLPLSDGNHSFVEWWATFDCDEAEEERWVSFFANDGFAKWLQSLQVYLNAA